MSVKNAITIWIDGINRTSYLVYPLKFGNFLDERLDECNVSLRMIDEEVFSPLTPVEIQITNVFGYTKGELEEVINLTAEDTLYYVVANDDAREAILGAEIYNHELYCVEVTKIAECVVVDTLTYTNDLGRVYTNDASYATPSWE